MEQLSLKKYGWKCILGAEVFYVLCLIYGALLPTRVFDLAQAGAQPISPNQIHHLLFELIPGFTWINAGSVIWGAVFFFIVAWIFAWYVVWMHNSSLVNK